MILLKIKCKTFKLVARILEFFATLSTFYVIILMIQTKLFSDLYL